MPDAWEVLDPVDQVIVCIREASAALAFLRRFSLGSVLTQCHEAVDAGESVLANHER